MPVRYCHLHARLWSEHAKRWMDFPLEWIEGIKNLYQWLQDVRIDTPEYRVTATACDRCDGQPWQEPGTPCEPP